MYDSLIVVRRLSLSGALNIPRNILKCGLGEGTVIEGYSGVLTTISFPVSSLVVVVVGAAVGAAVGAVVGASVGGAVGAAVGACVGAFVGAFV